MDPSSRYMRVTTRGTFTADDHLRMIDDIVSRPDWVPGMDALFDHRQLDMSSATYQVMRQATGNHADNDERIGNGRAAIVMRDAPGYASARQFALILEEKAEAQLVVFLSIEEAEAWLAG